jgi:hypothetical protein
MGAYTQTAEFFMNPESVPFEVRIRAADQWSNRRMSMSALLFGLVVLLGGLLGLAISNPLANLVTNWNLVIHQDRDVLEIYRHKKRRGIRLVAKLFLTAGGLLTIGGLVAWSLGAP